MLRFTIRELVKLTTIAALAVALIVQRLSYGETAKIREQAEYATNVSRYYEEALRRDGFTVIAGHIVRVGPDGAVIQGTD